MKAKEKNSAVLLFESGVLYDGNTKGIGLTICIVDRPKGMVYTWHAGAQARRLEAAKVFVGVRDRMLVLVSPPLLFEVSHFELLCL